MQRPVVGGTRKRRQGEPRGAGGGIVRARPIDRRLIALDHQPAHELDPGMALAADVVVAEVGEHVLAVRQLAISS